MLTTSIEAPALNPVNPVNPVNPKNHWHEASNSPLVILSTPDHHDIYFCVDQPHPLGPDESRLHGGISLFYRKTLSSTKHELSDLSDFSTFEHLPIPFTSGSQRLLAVDLYRSGSQETTSSFFNEFSGFLPNLSALSNIHCMY